MDESRLALRNARVIALTLPLGVVVFWAVVWFLTDAGQEGLRPGLLRADVATWIWVVVAVAGFLGAYAFRGRALQSADGGSPPRVLANLVVAWALLEAQALVAGVLFLLLATFGILPAAACVYIVGLELTFPRVQWFGAGDAVG